MEHNDRPWIKEEKSETQERFELEAEKERLKEEGNKRKIISLIVVIAIILIVLSDVLYK